MGKFRGVKTKAVKVKGVRNNVVQTSLPLGEIGRGF